jgi:hypothetical protein
MSRIKVEHGSADVTLDGVEMSQANGSTNVYYAPRDLLIATARTLLAVSTDQADEWAEIIARLADDQ